MKRKIDFQHGRHGRHLGFPIRKILAILTFKSTQCFLPSFESIGFFSLGEEAKNRFLRWLPSWISDREVFSYFWSTSHPKASSQDFQSIGLSVQRKTKQKTTKWFSRWSPWRPSWISNRDDCSYFWSISHPNASYHVWNHLAFGFRRRSEKYIFKMAAMSAILDFRSARF